MGGGRKGGNRVGPPLVGGTGKGLRATYRSGRDVMERRDVSEVGSGRSKSWHYCNVTVKSHGQLLSAVRLRGLRGEVGDEPVRNLSLWELILSEQQAHLSILPVPAGQRVSPSHTP